MFLDSIITTKQEEVAVRKQTVPLEQVRETAQQAPTTRDFRKALRAEGISLIAEIKRHSPSKGMLMEHIDPAELAGLYEAAGARAVSVLTDKEYFKGALQDLTEARRNTAIPCLRKDFIIDDYQIFEARAAHADAFLLIVRILSDEQLKDYLAVGRSLGMPALVETHSAAEIERAIAAGAHIIGINNRDLDTFQVDIQTTLDLKKLVPGGHVLVSESGIHTRDHVRMLEDGGVDAILVGEALVTSNNIRAAVLELLGRDER